MQWWCSAQTTAWSWAWQAYPGVWVLIGLLGLACYRAWKRYGGDGDSAGADLARRMAAAAGLLALWAGLDWPLGALGAGYLASAHMAQFLLITLVAPPLLLYGLPPLSYSAIESRPPVLRALRLVTHPLVALVTFNVVVLVTHWPPVVDTLMPTQPGSFVIDMSWLLAGALFWWPLVAPVPRRPLFTYWLKVGYLIGATILNTPIFAYLTFSEFPLYAIYELAPPVSGISTRVDQQLAGLLMKIGGGLILWVAISVIFFRWYLAEGKEDDRPAGESL